MASSGGDRINFDSLELSLIDSGIHSMRDVPLSPHLHSVNLHSNYIQRIEGLERLRNLLHLDLSANQIARMSGLEGLVSLKTLNLSCNLITAVEGVDSLRSLVRLNLSYNQIDDVSGLRSMGGSGYQLVQLELHGNKLRNVTHLQRSVVMCSSLRHLVLSQDGSSNPLCHQTGYDQELLSAVPQLETLNGVDRYGRRALPADVMDVPELEAYLDFLVSGGSNNVSISSDAQQQPNVKTPKIDQMLERFRQRDFAPRGSTSVSATDGDSNTSSRLATPGKSRKAEDKLESAVTEQDSRLAELEKEIRRLQLAQFKMQTGRSPGQPRSPAASSQRGELCSDGEPALTQREAETRSSG
ncbi:hypothetical protein BaRGS_00014918 [Batillaria attramentaria]|uniref:Leucine-rich repeat and coiled-coil domain-containing protein 1 n=1 Tax=Batillaria attramentaria TaxID=370345 RepID=A0ABD0L378_9CAEN